MMKNLMRLMAISIMVVTAATLIVSNSTAGAQTLCGA